MLQLLCTMGLTLAGVVFLSACGGSRGLMDDQSSDPTKQRPLSYYEATLRPSEFDEEVEAVQKAHASGESVAPLEIPSDSSVVERVEIQGYRIQIFASASIDEATAAQQVALERAGKDSVYVVYDPPVYRVRIGDYGTRLEANQRLSRIVNLGYDDAWVVADRVNLRRLTRVPKEEH